MANRYQQVKADELHKNIDELLYLSKDLSKSLTKGNTSFHVDSDKLSGLN